jgi:hypothetical protein
MLNKQFQLTSEDNVQLVEMAREKGVDQRTLINFIVRRSIKNWKLAKKFARELEHL